jgi:hypothetical protein
MTISLKALSITDLIAALNITDSKHNDIQHKYQVSGLVLSIRAVMLIAVMLSVILLSAIMLSVIPLSAIMLSVILLGALYC